MLNAKSHFTRLRHDFEITSCRIILSILIVKDIFYLFVFESILRPLLLIKPKYLLFISIGGKFVFQY